MKTSIEWTDATWNPVRGCSRISRGCEHCYAERMAVRLSGPGKPYEGFADVPRRHPQTGTATCGVRGHWTGRVELIPEKLDEPLRWRKPRRVFVNSMSDLFHEALPDEAIDRVFAVMVCAPRHTFQVLTKRPERMRRWASRYNLIERLIAAAKGLPLDRVMATLRGVDPSEYPLRNVWLGASPHDQESVDWMIPLLLQTPAAKRFVSLEPLLGPVDFEPFLQYPPFHEHYKMTFGANEARGLDWVIVGGESGPGSRPLDVAWIRSVVRQCREAGVACFVKQGGASNRCEHSTKGGHFECFPPDLQVREFPR